MGPTCHKNTLNIICSQVRSCFVNLVTKNVMAQLDSRMDIQFRNYNDQKLLNFAFMGSTYLNRLMDLLQQAVMQVCVTHTFLQR
jgi:hypothetical protein